MNHAALSAAKTLVDWAYPIWPWALLAGAAIHSPTAFLSLFDGHGDLIREQQRTQIVEIHHVVHEPMPELGGFR